MRFLSRVFGAAGLASVVAWAGLCEAQTPIVQPERLPAFGRSVAGTDDTTAIVLNPANIAFLEASELRWQGVYLDESLVVPWQGHAFSLGIPLPFSFATAIRLDLVDPPANAFGPGFANNYQWFTWALAYAPSQSMAIGFSIQRSYSDGIVADDLGSYSLGLTTRPADFLGLSFVAHHINGPLDGRNVKRLEDLGVQNVSLGAAIDTALAVRPLGTRQLEVGLEAKYLTEPAVWVPRATLGIDIPYVGRVHGEFAMSDPGEPARAWTAAASLSLYANGMQGSTEMEGGAVTGNGLGQDGSYNFFNSVAFRAWREPVGFDLRRYAIRIRLEDTPGDREHVALLRTLWQLAEEPRVDAVVFEIRTSPADSLAHIEELRDALYELRRHGKRTLCHLEDASGAALMFCAATNRVLINPAGGIRFAGLRTRHFFLKGLLDKIGVNADFVRIGAHKSAPEQFTRQASTEVARQDIIDLLQQNERHFIEDISGDRHIAPETLRERIAKGPFIAREAKQAGLVDGYAFDDQLEDAVDRLTGSALPLVDNDWAPVAPERFAKQRSIALVYVEGDMVDGRTQNIPFLDMKLVGSYTIADTLKKVRQNPRIAAVVLRVETPGGSSMAADVMWREIELTSKYKPVIVSMGSYAASGGYYISSPAQRIFASPLTITGSIGVFYGKADVSDLLRKIGVNVEVYRTAPRADFESIFRPFSDDERHELEHKVHQFYEMFVSRVAAGRHMTVDAVDRIGQGRVWTGEQARARGLVDELGGLRQALAYARKVADLPDDAPIIELPKIETSLIGRILGIQGIHSETSSLPPALLDIARALAPFAIYPSDKPLARLEIIPLKEPP